jgi:hypothetical protein
MENALLRERINDIAAEVAKLAMQLEGPNSAIEAMLGAEPELPAKAAKPTNGAAATAGVAEGAAPSPNASGQSHASRPPAGLIAELRRFNAGTLTPVPRTS